MSRAALTLARQSDKAQATPMGQRRWPINVLTDPAAFFESRIERDPNSGCWLWAGAMTGDGYGCVRPFGGKRNVRAHRFSLQLRGVDVAADAVVMHRCDTPACVNPDHLRVGTHADNIADKIAKGRSGPGALGKRWTLLEGSRDGPNHPRFGRRATACKHGHAFSAENTRITARGAQRCKACDRIRALAAHHAKKESRS